MKYISFFIVIVSQLLLGQGLKISSTVLQGKEFPKIDSEGNAHFRVYFPNAQSVILDGGDAFKSVKSTVTKSKDGFWDVRTSPIEVGFHYYWFDVDGKRTNDPSTNLYFGYNQPTSGIEIPSGEDFFLKKNVNHGMIISDNLYSAVTQGQRNFRVYLPPNYRKGRFPVLYLYHGTGEDITGWEKQGHIENILDNLFAEKKAKEMIVVMDYGVALTPEQEKMQDNYPRTVLSSKNLDQWLVNELIPYIDKKYKTTDNRAVAGLSRGSYQAMLIGANHPELFSAIGSFSSVIYEGTQENPFRELPMENLIKAAKKPLFFIGLGTKEGKLFDDFDLILSSYLKQNNYPFSHYQSLGTYHEWLTWRRCLYQFAPQLFKEKL